ncbi:PAS domain-containing protein [Clostridium autoethanogenum]|uniref:histidine kinase n=3 Tax=Clostridiaceae TaxID=31979 RepID=A0A1A6AVY0_9CLOT|nr:MULTISPECIES: sensor histidine kinase [Clostridium]OBR94193.1 putative sensor histidine kinase pdtaS [Clostridium ragsdalei P11]RMD01062.1 PAS domain-containing protein [Clostridium autoethanogenum]
MLNELCKKNTDLSKEDIDSLKDMEKHLNNISDLTKSDIFIDCLIRNSDTAIVVAEAKPSNYSSLYKNPVVGQLALRENEPAVLRTLETGMGTTDLKGVTQENIVVKQSTVPIKNNSGKIIGVLIMEKDITEDVSKNRNMEILSETTEQLTETLISLKDENTVPYNLINDAIVVFDEQGIATYANYYAEELYKKLGYKDKIVGIKFHNLVLNETKFDEIIKDKKPIESESNISCFSLHIKYAVTKNSHNSYGVIMLIKDITDIKQKEKEIILKAVAIREIHHRVKNNLQTIASILRLQSRRIKDEEAKIAFEESINRILSISATHEALSQNGIDDVDIKTILSKVRDNAVQCNKNINIKLTGDSFPLNSDKATSIAIVLNELIENSLKHAFKERSTGNIEITIKKGTIYSNIYFMDNGRGFDVNLVQSERLGLHIVKSMVKDKLSGDISIESNENGTKVLFYFKN